jgi:hypothetical protein
MNFFPQKRDLLTVEVNQFWIVEEKPVERSTCSHTDHHIKCNKNKKKQNEFV